MSKIPHSSNKSIHDALRVLAREIQSEDGAANVAIAEAADRISELGTENERLHRENAALRNNQQKVLYWEKLEAENAELRKQLLQKTQQLDPEYAYLKTCMERVNGVLDRLSVENAILRKTLTGIASASHFDNIGNWARNQARAALAKEAKL